MLMQSIVAAVLGAVAMTLSSSTEMHLRGRAPSTVPGRAANRLLRLVGVPQLEGRAFEILATRTHWVYGAAWGIVFWLLVGPAYLPLLLAGVLFFLIVWLSEQIVLPLLDIDVPWPWESGLRETPSPPGITSRVRRRPRAATGCSTVSET